MRSFILSCLITPILAAEVLSPLYMHNLRQPYIGLHSSNRITQDLQLNSKNWNFGGDAFISVNEQVRLTAAKKSQRGWLWSRNKLASESWVVEFEFKVHGDSTLPGDGFAFWYTTERESDGAVFGSMDKFTGLGVFFDTYMNGPHPHSFPYLNAMVGDGKTAYDSSGDGKKNEIGSCVQPIRNRDVKTRARVKFVKDQFLQVSLNVFGKPEWEDCFLVHNVSLPSDGYLGFSAHTGDVIDNHDIIWVTASSITNAQSPAESLFKEHGKGYIEGEATHYVMNFLYLCTVAAIIASVYMYSQRAASRNQKRF